MKEFRIFGPPGTGKTTRLAKRYIPRAVEKYGSSGVMVASFTRAAAKEIASRGIKVDEKQVGTLHSICYHALGRPELAIKHHKEWNAQYHHYGWSLKGRHVGSLDECGGDEFNTPETKGDRIFARIQTHRAKRIPESMWNITDQAFYREWQTFKSELGVMDFTDLIEKSLDDVPIAPGNPSVMFLDEAQDFTPLQLKLVRSWGVCMDWFVLVGDDDQAIFEWSGASPDVLLNPPIDPEFKTVLRQSYRVPIAVHREASAIIQRVKKREPKEYRPRDFEGEVVRRRIDHFKDPSFSVDEAIEYVNQGKSAMFLASCSYMLNPLMAILRKKGVPFHNPYRKRRTDWNPLLGNGDGVSSRDILHSFLDIGDDRPYWTVPQLATWVKYLMVGNNGLIPKQGKKAIKLLERAVKEEVLGLHTSREVLRQILSPEAVQPALDRNVDWLSQNVLKKRQRSLQYPVYIYKKNGKKAIMDEPKMIIGTIHSVKGGQADVVYLFPDISQSAYDELVKAPDSGYDSLYRLFYVGMTRAKEKLVILGEAPPARRGDISLCVEF